MRPTIRTVFAAALFAGIAVPAGAQTRTDIEDVVKDYIASHPEAIERVVTDYLANHPEVVQQAIAELIKRRNATAAAPDRSAEIRKNAAALFESPHQTVVGNQNGDVALVEFFDYNCGFCRRALSDTIELLRADPKLKIVLREFPILGPGSLEAAKISIAVRMQDPKLTKYFEFHKRLLSSGIPVGKASALAIAKEIGLDVGRLEKDMESDEVRQTIEENVTLARNLGINGTPGYVIGETIVPGAVGESVLKQKIAAERDRRPKRLD